MPNTTLFIAGIIPGIMTTVLLCMYIFIRVKMTPSLAPLTLESEKQEIETNRWLLLLKMTPVILLALIIFIFIYTGVATPTEIGAVGAVGSILLTFCYRRFSWYKLKLILLGTVKTTSMLFFLAIGGMAFAYLLSFIGLPQYLIGLILDLGVNRWVIIVAINVLLLILGCFLDPVGMIVIALPFIFPVIKGLGFDPIWFGVVMTLNMQIGMITPPVGINLFALRGALPHELKLEEIIQGSIPYVLVLLLALIIIILFPQIALFLPSIK